MERLEFLGDAVLGLAVAEWLFSSDPGAGEGELTRRRASLVCRRGLVEVAAAWHLSEFVRVGGGERSREGGIRSPSIVADAVEALIGAVFLDGGWDAARGLVVAAWEPLLRRTAAGRDAKTRLQEYTQARGLGLPQYVVRERSGAERFEAECRVGGRLLGKGTGGRKKEAEMRAAARALVHLGVAES